MRKEIYDNWHKDKDLIGKFAIDCLGHSYDPRGLSLYEIEGVGLVWLPKSVFEMTAWHAIANEIGYVPKDSST